MSPATIRVLHVEDNPGDARFMREILGEEASELDLCLVNRLEEAVERLAAERFDVVLLDLSLPDGHGLETVHRICAATPEVPIVVLTGFDDETLAIRAVQVGAQDYLLKNRIDGQRCVQAIRYAIERHRTGLALRSQSLMDDMTGLYNRRGFLALAEQQVRLANREHAGLVMVFCDLDDLKEINDTHGHPEGDLALTAAAGILREALREADLVARLGGDEFIILALDQSGGGGPAILARLRERFDSYNLASDRPYRLSMSMGLAQRDPRSSLSVSELLAEADRALYEEKHGKQRARRKWNSRTKLTHARTS